MLLVFFFMGVSDTDRNTPDCLIGWEVTGVQLFVHAHIQLTWIERDSYKNTHLSPLHAHQHTPMQSLSHICSHPHPFTYQHIGTCPSPHIVTNSDMHTNAQCTHVHTHAHSCMLTDITHSHTSYTCITRHIHSLIYT